VKHLCAIVGGALIVVACAPAHSPTEAATGSVWLIGDSISVAALDRLETTIPGIVIDATEGRQFAEGPMVLRRLLAERPVPDVIVVALGTNGSVAADDVAAIMSLAGDTAVTFVNVHVPRTWEAANNATLEAAVAEYGAGIVDWKAAAISGEGLLRSDAYHPSNSGFDAWVTLIADAVRDITLSQPGG
jgi:lysophospholipase L1-like esterase